MLKTIKFKCKYCPTQKDKKDKFYSPNELRTHMINDCKEFHKLFS